MPWTLYFPFDTVDDRIAAREMVSLLRHDPAVVDIAPTYVRGSPFTVIVTFREGWPERPQDDRLNARAEPFQLQPQLPPDMPIRSQATHETFNNLYGHHGDGAVTPEIRGRIIQQYITTSEGRSRLATAMAAPLRATRDYTAVARRTFLVEQLPDDALPMPVDIAPLEPPHWAVPGAWAVYIGPDIGRWHLGDIKQIVQIVRPAEYGSNGPNYVSLDVEDNPDIEMGMFIAMWCPSDAPVDPPTVWERLLGDDLF